MVVSATSPLVLYLYNFVFKPFLLFILFISYRPGSSGWFVRMKNNTIVFNNVLRTFEAEIIKIFKNNLNQKLDLLIKNGVLKICFID